MKAIFGLKGWWRTS
ncbi:trp operon leader peptide [Escherichia coli]|nr:trp operon leader peptide [Escherichia coli]HAM9852903.1 trp operon leader peptide [Escherichia coli]